MKETRRSLLTSVTALILCFVMLVGTTFAWFTDSATSANNIIKAGSLDISMEWSKDNANWNEAEGPTARPIFDYRNWEPGYTEVRYIKVQNLGNLAFKYQMAINPTGAIGKLAEVIDVSYDIVTNNASFVAPTAADKQGSLKKVSTLSELISGTSIVVGGVLLPDGETAANHYSGEIVICVTFHMQETAGNEYQGASIGDAFGINLYATQYDYENDSFDNSYDNGATWPSIPVVGNTATVPVNNNNGVLADAVTMTSADGKISATLPAGTKLEPGVTNATLSVSDVENSQANITLTENEAALSLDVHISGVAEDNDVPTIIYLAEALPVGLNMGNYSLYHVEDGNTNVMTYVADVAELDVHNEFAYDPATGNVTLCMESFSEVALVAEPAKWEGNFDYSWYTNAVALIAEGEPDYVIANADQLVAFGAIVGGMNGQTRDSFEGKTVKLLADINLGDKDNANGSLIFHPIGYTYTDDKNEDGTKGDYYSTVYSFEGTFDGNGHTIANFYQNTWEIKGDYDGNYYSDAMGLFGYVINGKICNLTVSNFSSDGEFTPTGVIAAYAVNSTFENIAITNCNPRVYNTGNGGIIGIAGRVDATVKEDIVLRNITVDNSNKISALWGSYDVACGGLVGMYRGNEDGATSGNQDTILFDNCHVSAQIDVYNDVCANYQYYAYRYSGMIIGSVRHNTTNNEGRTIPNMTGITATGCTVHFGIWNDYYYCEIIDNTTASYTHDYQMSRLTEIKAIDGKTITYLDGTTGTVPASGRANYVIVDYTKGHGSENATCYHFKDGAVWTHDMGGIQTGVDENGDGQDDLKEDKQHLYLEFNNLFTGYGWGVSSMAINKWNGITALDVTTGDHEESVDKFEGKVTELQADKEYKLSDIFSFVDNGVDPVHGALTVTITNLDENGNVIATFKRDSENWENGTISFENTGKITITIQDYYFCTPTTITVNVVERQPEVKFDVVMNNGDFLHRVGNIGTVALDKLFKAKDGVNVGTVSVTVTPISGNGVSGTYSDNAIQFSGTGVVKVTITDNDYCIPTVLFLEVVDATNVTGLSGEISGNVVLLNDCGLSSLTVSGRNTVFGNGFTATYSGDGRSLNNGLKQGVVTVSENGTLDNLRVVASIYPYMAFSYNDVKESAPKEVDGTKTRYYYQLSAISASGNSTITNCYVYGGRTNIFIGNGNVTIKDTILECGVAANAQIISSNEYTVTLENVTTIQKHVKPTIGDEDEKQNYNMLGLGILFGELDKDVTYTSPKLILDGDFKQYNWATKTDSDNIKHKYSGYSQTLISEALKQESFKRSINGNDAVNMGIVFLNSTDPKIVNNTGLNYAGPVNVSILTLTGNVYSLSASAPDSQVYSDVSSADRTTENDIYKPQFKYDSNLGGQYVAEGGDSHCYREVDTIKVMFPSGDIKEIDLSALVNISKYAGQNLNLVISVKDSGGNPVTVTNGKITLSAADTYTVTYTVTDTMFYDKDGKTVTQTIKYSWDVTISVSLKDKSVPNAYFEFDSSKQVMGYSGYPGSYTQFIPFLAGLKIWDYVGQNVYERFNGDSDYAKVAKVELTASATEGNHYLITVTLTDGGVITLHTLARADSGGSKYTGSIKTRNNVIYYVNDGTTSASTTTWTIDYYKFTGNNGVEINSGVIKFSSASATKPSSSFNTTIKYTVTYNANGGDCGQTLGYATSVATAVTLPTPSRSGYTFKGWFTAASGGTKVGGADDSYTPSANITLYAQWGTPVTITFDANGGNCNVSSVTTGGNYKLPDATRDGYTFLGWFDAVNEGNRIGGAGYSYSPDENITLYAHWQIPIYVTYNANGGSCTSTTDLYTGEAIILPDASTTQIGYRFAGWYTAASGGTRVGGAGEPYTPLASITLYAQWEKIQYNITYSNSNTDSVVGPSTATYGETVTVTVVYKKGQENLPTVTGGIEVSYSGSGTNYTYTFVMPADNVTMTITGSSCITPDTLITLADGTQVRVDSLKGDEMLLVWNMETGKFDFAPIMFVDSEAEAEFEVVKLYFSDGTEVKVIGEHGFWDYDLNKYVYLDRNAADYIGHTFAKQNGDKLEKVTLTDVVIETELTTAWSPVTVGHLCYFVNGMLSMPGGIGGLFNIFEVDPETMTYDYEQLEKDIETYGLFTYEELNAICPLTEEMFNAAGGAYLKISIGKGNLTMDELIYMINRYSKFI